MRTLFSLSAVLSVAIAQSWNSNNAYVTTLASGSSAVTYDSQTVTISAPSSGSSCSSAGSWFSGHPGSTGALWSSGGPWVYGGAWPSGGSRYGIHDKTFKVVILNTTNYFRYQHDAPFVVWNNSLAQQAADFAGSCTRRQGQNIRGENFAEGYPNVILSIEAWANERSRYSFHKGQSGDDGITDNFTQLVWKGTQSLGCAAMHCNINNQGRHDWYLVCEYWPSGNTPNPEDNQNGGFVQNVQSQVNDGAGFNATAAVQGTDGIRAQIASSTGPSTTEQTGENAANALVDARQDGNGMIGGQKGQLGLVIFFAFACAFL